MSKGKRIRASRSWEDTAKAKEERRSKIPYRPMLAPGAIRLHKSKKYLPNAKPGEPGGPRKKATEAAA